MFLAFLFAPSWLSPKVVHKTLKLPFPNRAMMHGI